MIQRGKKIIKKIIFNEEEFAHASLSATKAYVYSMQEAIIIAKYLDKQQLPSHLLESTLIHILSQTNPSFDPVTRYRIMNVALANAHLPLRSHEPVPIYQNDIDLIKSYNLSIETQKVLFTMLVIARFNRINPVVVSIKENKEYIDKRLRCNIDVLELFKIAKVSKTKIEFVFKELVPPVEIKIRHTQKKKNQISRILPFSPILEEEPLFLIRDFDNLIQYYLSLTDLTIKECTRCFHIFQTKTRHKICGKCRSVQQKIYFCQKCGRVCVTEKGQIQKTFCIKCYKENIRKINRDNMREYRKNV